MQGLPDEDISIKNPFVPFTHTKAIITLIIVGLIVFGNMLFNGFVYDDYGQLLNNPVVRSLSNINYFFSSGTFFDAGSGNTYGIYYRPLLLTTLSFLFSTFGEAAFGYHLFQLLLHIACTILLFLFFRKFFKEIISFFLALIFLVHPINQESVAYISDIQDVLFPIFGILALLLAAKPVKSFFNLLLINIFLFLSFLSKETGILFTPLLFYLGSLRKNEINKKIYYGFLLCVTIVYLYIRFFCIHLTKVVQGTSPIMRESFSERIISMPSIFFYYIKTLVFPDKLAVDQLWTITQINFAQFYLPLIIDLALLAVIVCMGIAIKKKKKVFPLYVFFSLWFLLGMLAHLQIVPLDMTVADRFFYFPFIGLLGMIGVIVTEFNFQKILSKQAIMTILIIIIVLFSVRTIIRGKNFTNSLTLCTHDLQIIPNTYILQTACGEQYLKAGQYETAKKYYAASLQLAPNWAPTWYEYGLSYDQLGDVATARKYYQKSIELSKEQHVSRDASVYISLAASYMKHDNQPQKAKEIVEDGLKTFPRYQLLQLYLAVCDYRLGNKKKALDIATMSYQYSPTPQARYVLNQISNNQDVTIN